MVRSRRRPIVTRTEVSPGDSFGFLLRQYNPATGGAGRGWDGSGYVSFSIVGFDDPLAGRAGHGFLGITVMTASNPSAGLRSGFHSCTREHRKWGQGLQVGGT